MQAEIADVLIYLARLADLLGVDVRHAVEEKLADNARRYPPERYGGFGGQSTTLI
ncbi:MazG-like family protein [Acidiferrimicrobium sp. IK]|uniref:MazG-like family protein n=1 Tax=Acidiferrimicrobium sp. IK TaxID=2871700 RepID=UPI003966E6F6